MPPVPHNFEPLHTLQARYPKALEHVYDVALIRDENAIRPGECAANVFDFEDGLRLIVSRERMPDGELVLHFSASFPAECRMADEFRLLAGFNERKKVLAMWLKDVPRRFAELSGDTRPPQYVGTSGNLIPHWMIPEA